MRLLHYSGKPFELKAKRYLQPPFEHDGFKPHGLWVSVEGADDWRSWCESEGFRPADMLYQTEIVLRQKHDVLIVDSLGALDAFQEKYTRSHHRVPSMRIVDWPQVAAEWNGLIIAPYQWERRLACGFMWYYGWDCASGCIWRPRSAIDHVKASEQVIFKETADA